MEADGSKGSYIDEELRKELIEKLEIEEESIDEDESEDDGGAWVAADCEDESEEEFSFARGDHAPPVTAEEVFYNGQIRPLFPLFNQKLFFSGEDLEELKARGPPVDKVFVQTHHEENNVVVASTSRNNNEHEIESEHVEITGPYCEWSKDKAIEAGSSPETCKKSNSTGFSKLWRFKEFIHRSNSEGRDAFVFLNPVKNEEKTQVKVNGDDSKKKKKVVKKSEAMIAHEIYMKRAKEAKSHLPYRQGLVGYFTNVSGGLTRNVHPF